jgi:transposase InsO family protein
MPLPLREPAAGGRVEIRYLRIYLRSLTGDRQLLADAPETRLRVFTQRLRWSAPGATRALPRVYWYPPQQGAYVGWGYREQPHISSIFFGEYSVIKAPAPSTIHAVLDRNGLITRRKRRRHKAEGTPLNHVTEPNALWCADYKGEFMLGNKRYCYPLTITDYHSRYLLACEGLDSTKAALALPVFERVFREFGLPLAIRTDNGAPFASPNALFGLSRLAIYWLRLGICIERIKPGCPQQNGRHERMHLTLKKEATKPASFNLIQQQERFENFSEVYNNQRPHQALDMRFPGELYTPSTRPYSAPEEPDYPFHDRAVRVTQCGRICIGKRKINLSTVFAGQTVGIREVDDNIWLVSFLEYDLGYFDEQEGRVEPGPNPFNPEL